MQPLGDLPVARAVGDQPGDLLLGEGELGQRVGALGLLRLQRVQGRALREPGLHPGGPRVGVQWPQHLAGAGRRLETAARTPGPTLDVRQGHERTGLLDRQATLRRRRGGAGHQQPGTVEVPLGSRDLGLGAIRGDPRAGGTETRLDGRPDLGEQRRRLVGLPDECERRHRIGVPAQGGHVADAARRVDPPQLAVRRHGRIELVEVQTSQPQLGQLPAQVALVPLLPSEVHATRADEGRPLEGAPDELRQGLDVPGRRDRRVEVGGRTGGPRRQFECLPAPALAGDDLDEAAQHVHRVVPGVRADPRQQVDELGPGAAQVVVVEGEAGGDVARRGVHLARAGRSGERGRLLDELAGTPFAEGPADGGGHRERLDLDVRAARAPRQVDGSPRQVERGAQLVRAEEDAGALEEHPRLQLGVALGGVQRGDEHLVGRAVVELEQGEVGPHALVGLGEFGSALDGPVQHTGLLADHRVFEAAGEPLGPLRGPGVGGEQVEVRREVVLATRCGSRGGGGQVGRPRRRIARQGAVVAGQCLAPGVVGQLAVQPDELVAVDRLEQDVGERPRRETQVVVLVDDEGQGAGRADALRGFPAPEADEHLDGRLVHDRDPSQGGEHHLGQRLHPLTSPRVLGPGDGRRRELVGGRGDLVRDPGVATGLAVGPQGGVGRHADGGEHLDGVGPGERLEVDVQHRHLAHLAGGGDEAGAPDRLARPHPEEHADRAGPE